MILQVWEQKFLDLSRSITFINFQNHVLNKNVQCDRIWPWHLLRMCVAHSKAKSNPKIIKTLQIVLRQRGSRNILLGTFRIMIHNFIESLKIHIESIKNTLTWLEKIYVCTKVHQIWLLHRQTFCKLCEFAQKFGILQLNIYVSHNMVVFVP